MGEGIGGNAKGGEGKGGDFGGLPTSLVQFWSVIALLDPPWVGGALVGVPGGSRWPWGEKGEQMGG